MPKRVHRKTEDRQDVGDNPQQESGGLFNAQLLDQFENLGQSWGEISSYQRVMNAVNGEEVDRLPICFWHHFTPEGSGNKLADATVKFFDQEFDLDIMKIMPDIPYPFPRGSIRAIDDWRLIEPIDAIRSRFMNEWIVAVQVVRAAVGIEKPVIVTKFNPLSEAMHFAADRETFFAHLREAPVVIHDALHTIAMNLQAQFRELLSSGADGVFFALQGCSKDIMSEEQYREFGRPYDLIALQGAQSGWLNVLHIHGERDLHFDLVLDYPVSVLSWSDRLAGPSLREARGMTSKCLMGGWHEFGALSSGPEKAILDEAKDALAQTGGRKFILANGCSVPDETDEKWLHYARDIVDSLKVH